MVHDDYTEDLKRELLTEMADNFFARRRALEARLERFAVLRTTVVHQGLLALTRWRDFRALLGGGPTADRFLAGLGFDPAALAALPELGGVHFKPRRSLALTAERRYRKTVLDFYAGLRQDLAAYNYGGYIPDDRNARRMRLRPGYETLITEATEVNEAIAAVNASQTPSDVIRFTKELDPQRREQEQACGGALEGASCRLDGELAYPPIAIERLGAPFLPTPPPLDAIRDSLAALADQVYRSDPAAAKALLATLRRGATIAPDDD